MNKYKLKQLKNIFKRYDEGIKLSDTMLYSVTKEAVADKVASLAQNLGYNQVVDVCSGAGGNTIAFAKNGFETIAVEINEQNCADSLHNARVYNVHNNILFLNDDVFNINFKDLGLDPENWLFHSSPEWGGPEYRDIPVFDVNCTNPPVEKLLNFAYDQGFHECCFYLPRTSDIHQLEAMGCYEVDYMYLANWCNAICAWFKFDS